MKVQDEQHETRSVRDMCREKAVPPHDVATVVHCTLPVVVIIWFHNLCRVPNEFIV